MKDLAWVPIPNRHDGESYARIMIRPDACEIFTAWILMLQVASRCHPRGTLLRNDGKPHDPETLSIKTRGQVSWFQKAIPILIEMSWIEQVTEENKQTDSVLSAPCQSGDEEGRKEQKEQKGSKLPRGFQIFWEIYPKSVDRAGCLKAWTALNLTEKEETEILDFLRLKVKSKEWTEQGGKFVPNPINWITKRGWEDKIKTNGSNPVLRKMPEEEGVKSNE